MMSAEDRELQAMEMREECLVAREPQLPSQKITRKRWLELVNIANGTCEYLEVRGVKKEEGCVIRRLADELWFLKKGE